MKETQRQDFGALYIVATPIGNLEDITLRALRILKEVDVIASEDTRHTKKLLSHFDIHTPLFSYYKDKEKQRAGQLVAKLLAGETMALVSDAGTPCISDPGAILVDEARKAGIKIVPIPGPSALTAALSAAGLQETSFSFCGFLPSAKGQRREFLTSVSMQINPVVFYESPKRIVACLEDCLNVLGDRHVFVARELTKIHEEILAGMLSEITEAFGDRPQIKGEFVVIVAGAELEEKTQGKDLDELLQWYKKSGRSLKDSVKALAGDLGLSRSEIYKRALDLWDKE
jgi:16S rRNA (cytidine1402-2'-O)-methyltransferase